MPHPTRRLLLPMLVCAMVGAPLLVTHVLATRGYATSGTVNLSGAASSASFPASGDMDDIAHSIAVTWTSYPFVVANGLTVDGVVRDASSGRYVAGATVYLTPPPAPNAQYRALTALTDAGGRYWFKHIAPGVYNLVAGRYTFLPGQPYMEDATQLGVRIQVGQSTVDFSLKPLAAPLRRTVAAGKVKNFILLDFDETYYQSWYTDTQMITMTQNVRQFARRGVNGTNEWAVYGYSPVDHYSYATGTYPSALVYDPWPNVPQWGQPDGVPQATWYSPQLTDFGQQSIFDVARGYGMSTAVIGGDDYPLGHINWHNVETIHFGPNTTAAKWNTWSEQWMTTVKKNPNGFLLYLPYTLAEGFAIENTSPDASGSQYQRATLGDDKLFGQLMAWLHGSGLDKTTDIVVVGDEAENDGTPFDNFYGPNSTKHNPFTLVGPNVRVGQTDTAYYTHFDVAPTMMYALGLPAPVDARGKAITSWFR